MWQDLLDIYKFRTLLKALVIRHLAVRYRGSLLGFLWSFLNPLALMCVYLLVFKHYIRYNEVDNYAIFLFCGLLPWIWFQSSAIEGTSSIVSSGHLITKSMFPAQLLPVVTVTVGLINYLLSLLLLFFIMLLFKVPWHLSFLFLPVIVFLQFVILSGMSLALGTLNVYFRDVQHIVANILTFLFFLIPVLYPAKAVPEKWKFTLDFNPLAVLITSYQTILLDGKLPSLFALSFLTLSAIVTWLIGNWVFNRYKESFAELL